MIDFTIPAYMNAPIILASIAVFIVLYFDNRKVKKQNKVLLEREQGIKKSMLLSSANFDTPYGKALKVMLENDTPVDMIIADIQNRPMRDIKATFCGFVANELFKIKL